MQNHLKIVEIEINHRCNLTCKYCPNSLYENTQNDEMSKSTFEQAISNLKEINYSGILSFSFYNEPLLSSNLNDFVTYAKQHLPNCKNILYTNGTLLNKQKFDDLVKNGIDKFVVTKHIEVNDFAFDDVYLDLSPKQKEIVMYQKHEEIHFTNRGGLIKELSKKPIPSLLPCYIPGFLMVITLEGDVLPCFEDYHKKNIMGSIHQQSLHDIWNLEKYKKFRHDLKNCLRHKHTPCSKCNRLEILSTNW